MNLDGKQEAKVLWTLSAIKLTQPAPSVYLKRWQQRTIFGRSVYSSPETYSACWAGWKAQTNWSLPAPRLMFRFPRLIPA
jgi:hypothetical protein